MKKFLSIILSILMVVTMLPMSVLPASAASTPTPYDGVPVTPQKISSSNYAKLGLTSSNWSQFNGYYAIRNAKELYGFAAVSRNSYTANAVLLQDIVVNANGGTTYDWTPIISSNAGYIYDSIFDGNGHYISGLYSTVAITAIGGNNSKFGGFICRLGGTAKNLVIKNSTFAPWEDISTYGGLGAITGCLASCTIQNCRVENITLKSINDGGRLGGIAGAGNGDGTTIKNCVSINVTFSGGKYTDPIASKAPYSNCYTSATASHNCTNLSVEHKEVKATCEYPGLSNYKYCLVCGKVTSGTKTETPATGHTLKSATCVAPKTCTICGATEGSVDNTAHSWANNDGICANGCGATCAHKNQTGSACKICGAELHVCSNYNNGFCTECDAYEPAELKDGYYQIKNGGNLFWYANYINTVDRTANAVLTADIDLENRPWTPIGSTGENSNNFRGIFDGQNYTIRGLYVEGGRAGLGFFGEVRTGTVKSFTIFGEVVVNTEVDYVGGVIGSICGVNGENDLERNGAIIQNIKSFVNLTAKAHGVGMIGGFVGYANHESLIENCSWYGTFDAGKYRVDSGAGGFIGKIRENTSEVTIRNCGAYGTIKTNYAKNSYNNTPTIYMGGFLSFSNTNAQTTLENCLFAGKFERGENLTDEALLGAFGTLRSVKAIRNCYYLGDDGLEAVHSDSSLKPGSDNVEITKVTEEQLTSGETAYKLGDAWGQKIGTDAYPILGGEDVYCGYTACDDEAMVYTNDSTVSATKPDHSWGEGSLTRPTKTQDGYYTYTCSACGETKTEPVLRAANYDDYTKALEDLRAYLDSDMLTDENKGYISEWLAMYDTDEVYGFIAGEEATLQEYIDATAYYASEFKAAIEDCLAGNHSGNGETCSVCGATIKFATVTDGTNTYYAADAATLNQAVTAILETGSRTFTVELPADAEAEMITAIRRAICDTDGVADGSINLTLKGVTSIPGTTNWDGVAFGPRNAQWDENNVEIVSHEEVTQLASVNLPDVTEIGAQAFYVCENLVSVSAPKAQTIGANAFGYTSLTSVEFPELTTIPGTMFGGTWTLSSAKFPKVTTIEQNGLMIGFGFAPENNPTPFPLELTAEGDITFNGSYHFNTASQNYSGKVDLVLNIDKKDQVTFNDDGTATWQVRDDLSYTFKSITFTCTDGTTNHSYTYTDNGDGTHDKVCPDCGDVIVNNENHTLTYTANGNTITATCSANCGYSGTATIGVEGKTYDGNAVEVVVSKTGSLENTIIPVTLTKDGEAFTGEPVNAGTYTASIGMGENENAVVASVEFIIEKANPVIAAAPTPNTLTYIGEAQYLISAGEAVGGTMVYSLTENGEYTTSIPQGTNAGDYTVWYYVQGDANHNDSAKDSVPVTIKKAPLTVTASDATITYGEAPTNNGVTYSGFVNGENEGVLGGELAYTYTYTQNGNVGNYSITPEGLTADNYEITFVDGTLTVEQIDIGDIIDEMKINLEQYSYVYDGTEKKPKVTSITVDGVTLTEGTDYTVRYEDNVNVGEEATAVITFEGNYDGTFRKWFTITKAYYDLTAPTPNTLTYNGEEQYLVSAGTVEGADFEYSLDAVSWSTSIPQAKDVGNYTVYYRVLADENHYGIEGTVDVTIKECAHEWDEGVLTRPVYDAVLGSKDGYYTYTCTICGEEKTEAVKSADYSGYEAVSEEINALLQSDDLTSEAKQEIYSAANECGLPSNDLTESEQNKVDDLVAELEKIVADAEEKIESGEYVKADYTEIDEAIDDIEEKLASENVTDEGKAELEEIKKQLEEMKADENTSAADVAELEKALEDYEEELDKGIEDGTLVEIDINKIADEADKKWKERFEAEGLTDEYEDFINNQKATDEALAAEKALSDIANSLEGTVAENAENIAKFNEMFDYLFASLENCLRGTHNFKDYEVTSPAKCEVNAIETRTCWFCGETDEREVEGTALSHSFTKYEETEAPKCGVEGKEVAYCDNGCQTTDERETPALEHIFLDYVSNGDATCTADGTKTASCLNGCGTTDTVADEGSMLDHTDEDGDKLCDDCGEEVYDRCDICGGKAHGDDKIQLVFCMIITIIRFVTAILKSIN